MLLASDFTINAIRVSECMLNAAEDMISQQPGEFDKKNKGLIRLSPSYSIRMEGDRVMLFSSVTRYIVWIPITGYFFVKDHENERVDTVISSLPNKSDASIIRKFIDELNYYGVLSAA